MNEAETNTCRGFISIEGVSANDREILQQPLFGEFIENIDEDAGRPADKKRPVHPLLSLEGAGKI